MHDMVTQFVYTVSRKLLFYSVICINFVYIPCICLQPLGVKLSINKVRELTGHKMCIAFLIIADQGGVRQFSKIRV
jgi:hypothetical protein